MATIKRELGLYCQIHIQDINGMELTADNWEDYSRLRGAGSIWLVITREESASNWFDDLI